MSTLPSLYELFIQSFFSFLVFFSRDFSADSDIYEGIIFNVLLALLSHTSSLRDLSPHFQ